MTLVIPADHYQCAWVMSQAGTTRPAVCTLGVHYTGDENDFLTNAELLAGTWGLVMGELNQSIHWEKFTMASEDGTVFEKTYPSLAGGDTDPGAVYQVAYLVKKITQKAGRWNRGRMFLPGVSEVDIDSAGRLTGFSLGDMGTAMGNFHDAITNLPFVPVILHNPRAGQALPTPPTPILSFGVDAVVATQRRRLRG